MATLSTGRRDLDAFYAPLDNEALLHITGPDSLQFLQGQTTCDTRLVSPARSVAGAYCTPQGRVVCDLLLAALGEEHFAMRMRADLLPLAAATFGKYIVFSRAELDAQRQDWQVVACWGAGAAGALEKLAGQVPGEALGVVSGEGYCLVQLDTAGEQFEAWLDTARHPGHLETIAGALGPGEPAAWQALQVAAGRARVEAPTSEMFLPQDLNYDRTGLVSFKKGCYTGQEIVARLHYRGKPKRRSFPAAVDSEERFAPGTPVYADGTGQSVGNLVNQGPGAALVCIALAALDKPLALGSPQGPALHWQEPPYPLD